MNRLLAVLLILSAAPVRAQSGAAPPVSGTITVSGEGVVSVAPDRALIRLGVMTRAATAADALREHEADVARVLTRVRSFGIPDRQIQIEALALHENYGENGRQQAVAIRVVTVTTDSLRTVPDLVAAVVTDGANRLDGLTYTLRDPKPAEARALDAAVADARAKAERIARASGVELGRVVAVQEGHASLPYPTGGGFSSLSAGAGAGPEPGAYSAGASEVRARVVVQFLIAGTR